MIAISNRYAGTHYTDADFIIPVPQTALREIYAYLVSRCYLADEEYLEVLACNIEWEERDAYEKMNLGNAQKLHDGVQDKNARWHFVTGKLYNGMNWTSEARKHFKLAVEAEPENSEYTGALNELERVAALENEKRAKGEYETEYGMGESSFDCDNACCRGCCEGSCECCGEGIVYCC